MADKSAAERTEQATPERIKRAREEGQVPHSQEASSALALIVLFLGLCVFGGSMKNAVLERTRFWLSHLSVGMSSPTFCLELWRGELLWVFGLLGPLLATTTAAGVLGGVIPGGATFTPKAVRIRWELLNPVTGAKRLVSIRSLVRVGITLAKMAAVLAVTYTYVAGQWTTLGQMQFEAPVGILAGAGSAVLGLGLRVAALMLVLALLDSLYQRWQLLRDLRMTKQELKEELKRHEGDPNVRSRIRQVQVQMARNRMMHEVPHADVVVTNPTHLAVALKYDRGTMVAPTVVAKGADLLAKRIVETAERHGVPVMERAPLARLLYKVVEIGSEVPADLYYAVAEVLAVILKTRPGKDKAS